MGFNARIQPWRLLGASTFLVTMILAYSVVSFADERRSVAGGASLLGDPYEIPTKAAPCLIEDELKVASRIVADQSYEARPEFMSLIGSFNVTKGQSVKKGQLLATSITSSLEKMRSIYQDYVELYRAQLRIAANSRKVAETRRDKIKGLTEKGVTSAADFEQMENTVVAAKQAEERMLRGLESMQKNVDLYNEQIKKSNFYSDIDGVVTELIVDPKSLSGNLVVMPGTVIAKVEKPGHYRAEAQLFDNQVHGVSPGMKAEVTLPDGERILGKVKFVSTLPMEPKGEQQGFSAYGSSQTEKGSGGLTYYKVMVEFSRSGPILPQNLLAEVSITKETLKAKSCLPWNAIKITDGSASIRVFDDKKGWIDTPVKLGKKGRFYSELLTPIPQTQIVKSRLW